MTLRAIRQRLLLDDYSSIYPKPERQTVLDLVVDECFDFKHRASVATSGPATLTGSTPPFFPIAGMVANTSCSSFVENTRQRQTWTHKNTEP